jgi:hypothetical protein
VASTVVPVCALSLGKAKVYEDSTGLRGVVEKFGRLDIAVDNALLVYGRQCSKQTLERAAHM